MSKFENKCCKILGVVLLLLVISMWLQLSGCSSCETQVPPPPSDYIDEVETSNLVYIKYIPDWYVVPDKLEDRLILPIHFIDGIEMGNFG